jgi:hypothetical protein
VPLPFLLRRRSKKTIPIMAMRATMALTISGEELDPDEAEDGGEDADAVEAGAALAGVVGGAAAASRGLVVSAGAGAFRALRGSMMP